MDYYAGGMCLSEKFGEKDMVDFPRLENFIITHQDLLCFKDWCEEQHRGLSLEEMTRKLIRDRLEKGIDQKPLLLPEWVHQKNVLSWNEEDKWKVGSQVIVARSINGITPFFGAIINIQNGEFHIQIGDEIIKYEQVKPGSIEAQARYKNVRRCISEYEDQQKMLLAKKNIDEQMTYVIFKYGDQIASLIDAALKSNSSFISYVHRWYLRTWIYDIPIKTMLDIHREMLKANQIINVTQFHEQIPDLPEGLIGELSISYSIDKIPNLFQKEEEGWRAIKPPPPSWELARGIFYVYDPETFAILLQPGQRLIKVQAERLQSLGLYDDMVESISY